MHFGFIAYYYVYANLCSFYYLMIVLGMKYNEYTNFIWNNL